MMAKKAQIEALNREIMQAIHQLEGVMLIDMAKAQVQTEQLTNLIIKRGEVLAPLLKSEQYGEQWGEKEYKLTQQFVEDISYLRERCIKVKQRCRLGSKQAKQYQQFEFK